MAKKKLTRREVSKQHTKLFLAGFIMKDNKGKTIFNGLDSIKKKPRVGG